jgi:hypothetical protein
LTKKIGRPATGQKPKISFRLSPERLAQVDAAMARGGKTAASILASISGASLSETGCDCCPE